MSRKSRSTTRKRVPAPRPVRRFYTAAEAAAEMEADAERYPERREELLHDAAGEWSEAGEYGRAVALYERLLAEGPAAPELTEAFRISALWDAGRETEARAAAALLRRSRIEDAGAWNVVAELFEAKGEYRVAAEWFTAGITQALGATTPLASAADLVTGEDDVDMLVTGRHRVRRRLGEPHDDGDELAHELHQGRGGFFGELRSLDELHDPRRMDATWKNDPEMMREEMLLLEEAAARADARDAAAARPRTVMTCVLFWPEVEFGRLLDTWPAVADEYGTEHAGHLRQVERTLRGLSDQGDVRLAVGQGSLADLDEYARGQNSSPAAPATRSAYAAELARIGHADAWPPPRNGLCWCRSGRKYKKCCGNPALS
ncbi:SEC-C domain-containing protein [Streptomyces sp. NPDC096310]|uniref:SEC-C domain-containing protein n=1 Tax=Streptomyces sp. NPDC096310 TaxID=3366082 RepID=UPI003828A8DD